MCQMLVMLMLFLVFRGASGPELRRMAELRSLKSTGGFLLGICNIGPLSRKSLQMEGGFLLGIYNIGHLRQKSPKSRGGVIRNSGDPFARKDVQDSHLSDA